jgi:hypothetical protein
VVIETRAGLNGVGSAGKGRFGTTPELGLTIPFGEMTESGDTIRRLEKPFERLGISSSCLVMCRTGWYRLTASFVKNASAFSASIAGVNVDLTFRTAVAD